MVFQEITIRPASLNDADAIWGIYQATIPETTRNDEEWQRILRQGGMFIAELEETAIAFGGIDFEEIEQIRYVYVIPEYQRSGLRAGLRILETLEAAARQKGIVSVRLHSTPNAVKFYLAVPHQRLSARRGRDQICLTFRKGENHAKN